MSDLPCREELAEKVKHLEKSNKRYESFVHNCPDLFYRTDLDGKIVYISPAVYDLTGYTVREVIGMKMAEEIYLIPEQRLLFIEKLQKHGQVMNFEAQLKKKDGSVWWASTNAHFYKDKTGNILGVEGITRDITRLRVAHLALKETEERFRLAFLTIPDAINLNRVCDGVYIDINEGFTDLTGYTREDVIGKPSFDINIWKNADDRKRLIEGLMATGHVKNIEAQFVRKNGEVGIGLMSARILDINNEAVIQSITKDITERKQVEEALQMSEERLSAIVNSIADWVWEVDLDGRYIYCSQNVKTILGYSSEEMIGKTPFDFMLPDEAEKVSMKFKESVAQKRPIKDLENWNINKNNDPVCLLTNGVPTLNKNGELIGFRGVDKDITEQKYVHEKREELEAQLQQNQKMEAIGTLAGGIAHDFNNILSGIFGYSQLAKSHMKNPEKANEYIEQIIKGAQRATDLTRQILTFSRQSEYQKQPIKIDLEITEALKLLRSSIPSTIEIKARVDSKRMVLADPTKIHQVIMNLCTNAYHAMRKTGGCLTVSLTDITILESSFLKEKKRIPGKYIKLEVSDTGHGMDEKTLEKAFDPYFTTKKKGDGTGLGLALVQAIVEEHDGFLEVNSELGKGSRFSLCFPIVRQELKEKVPKTQEAFQLAGNETIMIVDDEGPIRESYKDFLEDYGYQVQTFSNGIDAFDAFKIDPAKFDLIVTDMTMPGLTGDKLASKILKLQPDIPIVLCTGFSENITQEKAIQLGISQFIQKPFLNQDLMTLIRSVFDKKK